MKHGVFPLNRILDSLIVPDVASNLVTTQRLGVGVENLIKECDGITHAYELFSQVTANEPVSTSYEDPTDAVSPHFTPEPFSRGIVDQFSQISRALAFRFLRLERGEKSLHDSISLLRSLSKESIERYHPIEISI